jgi:hypothetical protein
MKLYTEEQVNKAIRFGFTLAISTTPGFKEYKKEFIDSLTPIELPSDEEIESLPWGSAVDNYHVEGFKGGAKWMRDKLTNTKEK